MKEEPSIFIEFFGDKPVFRIIDFLLENRLQDFTKSEIAKGAGVSWASLFNHWKTLEKYGIVKVTRTVGKVRLYQLDEGGKVVQSLKQICLVLIKHAAEEACKEEMVVKARARR
jgi:DNA-binding transcriptional ArsR family regulator